MKLAHALRISPGEVIAFTGGGGKTTAMFQLAAELAPGMRVLTTTTTRIFGTQAHLSPAHHIFTPDQRLADVLPALNRAIDQFGQVLLIGPTEAATGKAFGLPPEFIDQLAATGQFGAIIIEADGSRMLPFKAPAAYEPVIPDSTTLVTPVVGLDVLGCPLTAQFVHRPELVSQISGAAPGQPVSTEVLAAVLAHPAGGLKNIPPAARVIPLLNKIEQPTRLEAAQSLAAALLNTPQIEAVAIGATQSTENPVRQVASRVAVVVLAAGGATRFGSPKQLARWQNGTLIEQAVDTALKSQAATVTVVLGNAADRCRAALGQRPVQIVENKAWSAGQSTSMRAGLAGLPPHAGAVIFLLVDQPGITATVIDALIERHRATLAPVIWPEFNGERGNPVLFDRALFGELAQVTGDTGGRPILQAYRHRAERVAVNTPGILLDIDRPEDLP